MNPHAPEFSRNLGFISVEEQAKLNESTVAIAGAGGDGGAIAIQLARLGVGTIRLADPDPFEAENINRQAYCSTETVGKNKAEVIADAITKINPGINTEVYATGISQENAEDFVSGSDLLIDETEFSLHALGVMLARSARKHRIPNLMAMNIGFGATVTTFSPAGKTFEEFLGFHKDEPIATIAEKDVDIKRWLPYIPPYGDMEVFKTVASGEKSAPSIAPGVNLASAIGSTQSILNLLRSGNNRPNPVYAPKIIMMDVMSVKSKIIKYPRLSTYKYFARLGLNNFLNRNPRASY